MDMDNVRRASSAGYRLPERSNGTRPTTTQPPADKTRYVPGETAAVAQNPDKRDPVKQDQVWKDFVWRERRAVLEWEKNWDFLRNYDQMGQLKSEEPLPSNMSVFSDHVPNTTNRVFGSLLSTPLGRELVRLDTQILWQRSNHRCKQDPELLPC